MRDVFEYDVFLSFASADQEFAQPIWQQLSLSGLRVFWSDETLKENVGQSFVTVVEAALTQSRHFVLICTPAAMTSNWVRMEYQSFLNHFYIPSNGERRLIIFEGKDFNRSDVPLLLRNIQTTSSVKHLISTLGGIDIPALRRENAELQERLRLTRSEVDRLTTRQRELEREIQDHENVVGKQSKLEEELRNAEREIADLKSQNREHQQRSENQASEKRSMATREISWTDRYETLKAIQKQHPRWFRFLMLALGAGVVSIIYGVAWLVGGR